jgi:GNAT superfamily N-acetyltransferase
MSDPVEITRGGRELLDELRPLWLALRTHHHEIAPELGPVRADDATWSRRRAADERWLEDERAVVLLARRDGRAVGYAFVRTEAIDSATWETEGVAADLETLSILPEARGAGVGARLIALVREEVERRGYVQLYITAVAQNAEALRFYEREGFAPAFVVLAEARDRSSSAARATPRRPGT